MTTKKANLKKWSRRDEMRERDRLSELYSHLAEPAETPDRVLDDVELDAFLAREGRRVGLR